MSVESGAPFSPGAFLRHHLESVWGALRGTPLWVWPLPFLLIAAILLILQTPLAVITAKPVQEVAGPALTGLAAVAAIALHRKTHMFFALLLACLTAALCMREWHFWGTSEAIIVAVAGLAWWASSRREEILPHLRASSVGALLLGAFWLYAIAQFLDQHYLLTWGLFDVRDYVRWNDNVEETLETAGHLMILAAVLLTWRDIASKGRAA